MELFSWSEADNLPQRPDPAKRFRHRQEEDREVTKIWLQAT